MHVISYFDTKVQVGTKLLGWYKYAGIQRRTLLCLNIPSYMELNTDLKIVAGTDKFVVPL